MENTKESVNALFDKAKSDLIADMKSRDIGAIIWNNATAGFQYLPEIAVKDPKHPDQIKTIQIMGLYRYEDVLYLIEEGIARIKFNDFWNPDTEAAPTVVTLTEDLSVKDLGDPKVHKGYTTQGSLEEWMAIADCYFTALTEN